MPRRRRSPWLFLKISSLEAVSLRMEGAHGVAARQRWVNLLEDTYDEMNMCPTQSSGVAVLTPDGTVVAAYYAPGDPRNTAIDYPGYCLQHGIVDRFRYDVHGESANDVKSFTAYLPAAARGRDLA